MSCNQEKEVVLLAGLPGSGKSTYIQKNLQGFHVHGIDRILDEWAADQGVTYDELWNQGFAKDAKKHANIQLRQAVNDGKSIVCDMTNMTPKIRKRFLKQIPEDYRKKTCVCFLPPVNDTQQAELDKRLANRPGKTIPRKVMENFAAAFLPPSHDEGWTKIKYYNIFGSETDCVGNVYW